MALLSASWLLVESFIVPHGFIKWFYLSFYINPLFLVFCQVFLWLNQLMNLLILLFYPLRVAFRLNVFVFGLIGRLVLFFFSYIRPKKFDVYFDAMEPLQDCEMVVSFIKLHVVDDRASRVESRVVVKGKVWRLYPNLDAYEEIKHDVSVHDSWLNEYLNSDHYSKSVLMYYGDSENELLPDTPSFRFSFIHETSADQDSVISPSADQDSVISPSSNTTDPLLLEDMLLTMSSDDSVSPQSNDTLSAADVLVDEGYWPSYCSSDSPTKSLNQQMITSREIEDIDPFHNKYSSRMRFFNVLYLERLHGINAILNEQLSTPVFSNCIEQSRDYLVQYKMWSSMARKRVLRSLECDLEMICVAQSCLFWEALDHQYHKVESLTLSNDVGSIAFHHNISGKFQELQIQLEKFVEDQRLECHGSSNNISTRLSFQGLLQVPDVTGFIYVEEENKMMMMMKQEYSTRPTQILEAIEKCIKAFWSYMKTDNQKKSFWKYKEIWRTHYHPPVEDPQDLVLLYQVMKNMHKKELMLRGVEGKSKCWVRRKVKPMQLQGEDEKRSLLFAMIDMRLVQNILKMSLVSRSHLKWCQEKIDSLEFVHDKVCRARITHLFPSS